MKLYLSSYKVGDNAEGFKKLVGKSAARVAIIDNSRDYSEDLERKARGLQSEFEAMSELGFTPEHLDLRNYFGKSKELVEKLSRLDVAWVIGGNSFLLRRAMEQSGFHTVIDTLIKTNKLVYAGYSAGICVLAPSLRGVEMVDDPTILADGYNPEIIWDGLGLIDFYPIVHYDSDHPESALVDRELAHIQSLGIPYKTLRDGDTIIIDTP